jgi:hypothetical protein
VLTLRTTVKRNGDSLANARMAMSEYVALGAQARACARAHTRLHAHAWRQNPTGAN